MEIIPAIDLSAGRIVRLSQGDFERATEYGDDPESVARGWAESGARLVHIVDLDGARAGWPVQSDVVARVVAALVQTGAEAQVAGGLRTDAGVQAALDTGATRVVLGTALLREPALAARLIVAHGQPRIVAALDVREGAAVGEAWRDGAARRPVAEALDALRAAGVRSFAVTAIMNDGLLNGPDMGLLARVRAAAPDIELIASGGVSSLDDLRALRDLGAEAVIVGRALYEGRFDLTEAIAAVS